MQFLYSVYAYNMNYEYHGPIEEDEINDDNGSSDSNDDDDFY